MNKVSKENKLNRGMVLLIPIIFLDYLLKDCGDSEFLAGSSGKVGIKSDFFEDILKSTLKDVLKDGQNSERSINTLAEDYMLEVLSQENEKIFSEILPTKTGLLLEDIENPETVDIKKIKTRDFYKNSYLFINQDSEVVKLLKSNFKEILINYFGKDMDAGTPFFDASDYIEYQMDSETGDILVDNLIQVSILTKFKYIIELIKLESTLEERQIIKKGEEVGSKEAEFNLTKEELERECRFDLPINTLVTLITEPCRINYFK